jgi:hypothetical protein
MFGCFRTLSQPSGRWSAGQCLATRNKSNRIRDYWARKDPRCCRCRKVRTSPSSAGRSASQGLGMSPDCKYLYMLIARWLASVLSISS